MSGISKKLMGTTAAGGGALAIEDVFSTYLYTGTGSAQTITNGIDLAGEGGLVWIKGRSTAAQYNVVYDTERGATKGLYTNASLAEGTRSGGLTSFTSSGFSVGNFGYENLSGDNFASWTWRKAPRWFDVVTYTGNGTAGRQIAHNLGVAPGCMIVKRTDSTGSWKVYHRSNTAAPQTDYLNLEGTGGTSDLNTIWNDTQPTDTVFTVGTHGDVNANGATYVAYLFAHDPLGPSGDGSDGLIACGSVPASAETTENLGWEPQWLLIKRTDSTGDWQLFDNMRGFFVGGPDNARLRPNLSNAEDGSNSTFLQPRPTGFYINTNFFGGGPYIYIAIRRGPMRQPTSGTEVFAPVFGDGSGTPSIKTSFPVDMGMVTNRASGGGTLVGSRITGAVQLNTSNTNAESSNSFFEFDFQNGWHTWTGIGSGYINWNFRRAPGFFDVVAYSGSTSNQNINHSLGVVPELIIIKVRNGTNSWPIYNKDSGVSNVLYLNQTWGNGSTTRWNSTAPTETQFTLQGSNSGSNTSGENYIAYLFASCPGVSKVGSFVYDSTLGIDVDCGFTSGARFVLCKKTTGTGGAWFVFDTARGIVAGNDPTLELNNTNAEYSTYDLIDPLSSGFRIPVNSFGNGTYIYLAIA